METATPLLIPGTGVERVDAPTVFVEGTDVRRGRREEGRGSEGRSLEGKERRRDGERRDKEKGKARERDTEHREHRRTRERSPSPENDLNISLADLRTPRHPTSRPSNPTFHRTRSMSPPASTFVPLPSAHKDHNTLALELGMRTPAATEDAVTEIDASKVYSPGTATGVGSAEDLARVRALRERELQRSKDSSPHKSRGYSEVEKRKSSIALSHSLSERERLRLRQEEEASRARSRATTKRSSRSYYSSRERGRGRSGYDDGKGGFLDWSSMTFQAIAVVLSSSVLMITVTPRVGGVVGAVAAVAVVLVNMTMVSSSRTLLQVMDRRLTLCLRLSGIG